MHRTGGPEAQGLPYAGSFPTEIRSPERNLLVCLGSLESRFMILKPYPGHTLMLSLLEEDKDRFLPR